jgi:hypothetical protein
MRDMSPPPIQADPRFVQGVGVTLDALLSSYKDAIKARFPTYAAANADDYALANIGFDSSLPRYPSETDVQYGARLQQRWVFYERAGAAESPTDPDTYFNPIVRELEGLGFGDVSLIEYVDWPADGSNPNVHHSPGSWYDSTGTTPWWSRFWVYVGQYDGSDIPGGFVWGTGTWGSGVWGFDLPADVVSSAVAAVLKWKPAHALCPYLAFLTDGTPMGSVWGSGTWGTFTWGATGALPGVSFVDINR